jgi:hypothetical protein
MDSLLNFNFDENLLDEDLSDDDDTKLSNSFSFIDNALNNKLFIEYLNDESLIEEPLDKEYFLEHINTQNGIIDSNKKSIIQEINSGTIMKKRTIVEEDILLNTSGTIVEEDILLNTSGTIVEEDILLNTSGTIVEEDILLNTSGTMVKKDVYEKQVFDEDDLLINSLIKNVNSSLLEITVVPLRL